MYSSIQIQMIKPWWVRFTILVFVGIPSFTGYPISNIESTELAILLFITNSDLITIFSWLSYAIFIWLLILLFTGLQKLVDFLTIASLFGLSVALFKTTIGRIPILSQGISADEISINSIILLIKILTMIPYALVFVQSFSFTSVISNLSHKATTGGIILLHLAIFLRSFQYTIERFTTLLTVWIEENPKKLLPRYDLDLRGNILTKTLKYLDWIRYSAFTWVISSLVNTLEVVPVLVKQTKNINKEKNEK